LGKFNNEKRDRPLLVTQLSLLPFWPSWLWCFVWLHLLYPRCSQLFTVHLWLFPLLFFHHISLSL
jgi:hypothetical protein